uniref:Uncharacterized protein n=1 Tax=Daphnia galeata TaxID=27404 RepID=A0A8J2RV10_9CRUS|nr:unnamed protein product [Daphnia galeata]
MREMTREIIWELKRYGGCHAAAQINRRGVLLFAPPEIVFNSEAGNIFYTAIIKRKHMILILQIFLCSDSDFQFRAVVSVAIPPLLLAAIGTESLTSITAVSGMLLERGGQFGFIWTDGKFHVKVFPVSDADYIPGYQSPAPVHLLPQDL